jgi:hypothetical protein
MSRQAKQKPDMPENNQINSLMEQIKLLQEQINLMKESKGNLADARSYETKEEPQIEFVEINGKEYIGVMSINPVPLILSTQPRGGGKVFNFSKFGEVKRIMYDDVVAVIENHPTFAEQGRFYILDNRVIRYHGLDEAYNKILTKEQIEKILNNNGNALDLYNAANDAQKKIIVEFLVKTLRDNPDSVDLNLVDKISRISGVKIQERAEESRQMKLENLAQQQ